MEKIKLTQIVNMGLLIEGNNKKILIDGIHFVKTHEWSTVNNNLMEYIIYGKDKFQNINYLLFTHQHNDHFNLEKTCEYIRNNDVEKLLTTKTNDLTLKTNNLLIELNKDYYEVGSINSDGIKISYIRTKHLSHEKIGIEHYLFIIEINNKNILFLGDADFCKTELIQVLIDFSIDIIVAPFIIINSIHGRNFVKKFNPQLLILNHLPNKDDDIYNYRNLVEKNIEKYKNQIPDTVIFQNLYDELVI